MSFSEPKIIVNGVELTNPQAITVRVAVTSLLSEMSRENTLGCDEHGRTMTRWYRECSEEILRVMKVIP